MECAYLTRDSDGAMSKNELASTGGSRIEQYALLDCSREIRVPHLAAAIAVWHYCYRSAELIFGDALGDPVADIVLTELRKSGNAGLTRSQISKLFGRHRYAAEINRALNTLVGKGLAVREVRETEGRSAEVWFAKEAKKAK